MLVCALGDLLLDLIVRLEEPLGRGDDARAKTRVGAGGQAANVAAWAAFLGARARLIAKRADDACGRLISAELAERGVEVVGPVVGGR
ncbi:MAG: ribokinase, partial [Chloroflexota bacterium]